MWKLLQKIEDLGWKPYGKSIAELTETEKNVRLLTSLSSGLWQFVCENNLENPKERKQRTDLDEDGREYVKYSTKFDEYRLIESALKDESELEDFLLSNIVIKDEE